MPRPTIRVTVEIPDALYRKLERHSAVTGKGLNSLILLGIKNRLLGKKRPRARRVNFPLIRSTGPKVNITKDRIYGY